MAKREFLQLAHTYNSKKYGVAGWFVSEKLDGMRCFWDGGISRDRPASLIPWANTQKDARYKEAPVATGLWTRYGKVIHAPDWFLDNLPPVMLDGELYAGKGNFQKVISITKKLHPYTLEWLDIQYVVFDAPRADEVFADGEIKNTNFKKVFSGILGSDILEQPPRNTGFAGRYKWLKALEFRAAPKRWHVHNQVQLPFKTSEAEAEIVFLLAGIIAYGGEGLILKSPSNLWVPERSHTMLKHKAVQDAEGTVVGYIWGRETDKGSKLLGLMGALILKQDNGRILELSGFTDSERELASSEGFGDWIKDYGGRHPGEKCADHVFSEQFPRGSRITYRYRELTDDGVAKEARFWRKA